MVTVPSTPSHSPVAQGAAPSKEPARLPPERCGLARFFTARSYLYMFRFRILIIVLILFP